VAWSRACTSRQLQTCSAIRPSRLPATSTATRATRRHARRSTAGAGYSGYDSEHGFDSRCATYPHGVPDFARTRTTDKASTCENFVGLTGFEPATT
jgi:hypothetical protein